MKSVTMTQAVVAATCEACGHAYRFNEVVRAATIARLNESLAAARFQGKACPRCGYIQSWMIPRYKSVRKAFSAVLGITLGIGGTYLIGKNATVPEAFVMSPFFYIVLLGPVFGVPLLAPLIFKPNRRYLREHGAAAPAKAPKILSGAAPGAMDRLFPQG